MPEKGRSAPFARLPGTDLWDTDHEKVATYDWRIYDLFHTVLPTKLPLEEVYKEEAHQVRRKRAAVLREQVARETDPSGAAALEPMLGVE